MKSDKNSRTHSTMPGTPSQSEQAVSGHSPKRIRISYDNWLVKYRPIKNPFDANAPFDGCMFETYGPDLEFVRQQPSRKIWTLVDDGDRNVAIYEGFHFVDRIGYFITEVPFPSNCIFRIKAD